MSVLREHCINSTLSTDASFRIVPVKTQGCGTDEVTEKEALLRFPTYLTKRPHVCAIRLRRHAVAVIQNTCFFEHGKWQRAHEHVEKQNGCCHMAPHLQGKRWERHPNAQASMKAPWRWNSQVWTPMKSLCQASAERRSILCVWFARCCLSIRASCTGRQNH